MGLSIPQNKDGVIEMNGFAGNKRKVTYSEISEISDISDLFDHFRIF
jgi:hypothetical protein